MYFRHAEPIRPRRIPVKTVKKVTEAETTQPPVEKINNQEAVVQTPAGGENRPSQTDWREKALRLQAEMENFRKRQTRRANEAIEHERERLFRLFLPVADNLARALSHQHQDDESLRQGVELTHRQFMRLLETEGISRLETVDQPFDPEWHEAISAIPAPAKSGTIIEEIEAGYKLGDKLLRPAKVVVAA